MIIQLLIRLRFLKAKDHFRYTIELLRYLYLLALTIGFLYFEYNLTNLLYRFKIQPTIVVLNQFIIVILTIFTIKSVLFDKINIKNYGLFIKIPISKYLVSILILNSKMNYSYFLIIGVLILLGIDFGQSYMYFTVVSLLMINIKYTSVFINTVLPINILYIVIAILLILIFLYFNTNSTVNFISTYSLTLNLIAGLTLTPAYVVIISKRIYLYA